MSGGSIAQGLFGGFGQPGAPGFVPGTVSAPVNAAAAGGANTMINRYAQLGLGGQGATPTSPGGGSGITTPSLMDIGALPSYTGGIAGEGNAVLGQLQNQTLQSPTGKNTSPASILGTIGRII